MGIRLGCPLRKGEKTMNEEQRIKLLEEELKILKNEVKTILLDIREQYLNIQNPFNMNMVANTPPAGSNPDIKSKELAPVEDTDLLQDEFQTPPAEEISFGKPFADLSAKADLPGGGMDDMPGAGPAGAPELSAGAGPTADAGSSTGAGSSNEGWPSAGMVDDDEPPQKNKSTRSKKKREEEEEMELDEDTDSDNEELDDEELETKPVLKMQSPKNGKKKSSNSSVFTAGNSRADLVIIAGLTQWVDQSTAKLGKDRTEALVEMSTAMGRIPDRMKDVLIRMIRISRYEANGQTPTATDYLAILAQLESLISGSQVKDSALLSVLSMMKESGRG